MDNPTTTAVVVEHQEHKDSSSSLLSPDLTMLILTWVTFFALFVILQKFAWKPIINALEKRENEIKTSLDNADRIKFQLAEIEISKAKALEDAKVEATRIIDEARKNAQSLAHDMEAKAKVSAQDIIKNANIQIEGERQHVREVLKKESVNIAITLAGKILKENTDTDKNRRLVESAVKEL